MKVLVAAKEFWEWMAWFNIPEDNDFCWADEGEIVMPAFVCGHLRDCDCDRSLIGVKSRKATTIVKVVDKQINKVELIKLFESSIKQAYLPNVIRTEYERNYAKKLPIFSADMVDRISRITKSYAVGTILRVHSGQTVKPL